MTTPVPAITTEQMREVDRLMIEVYGIALAQMMEQAGGHLAELARSVLDGGVVGRPVVVAAGRGNNGGGGLVAARHLSNWGAEVLVAVEAGEGFTGVPAQHWQTLAHLPVVRRAGHDALAAVKETHPALVLDALIGYGLRGSARGWIAEMIQIINQRRVPILALDVPSGLDATTGAAGNPCVRASATMTLALPKTGLLKPEAKRYVGDLYLADISVPPALYRRIGLEVGPIFATGGLIRLES